MEEGTDKPIVAHLVCHLFYCFGIAAWKNPWTRKEQSPSWVPASFGPILPQAAQTAPGIPIIWKLGRSPSLRVPVTVLCPSLCDTALVAAPNLVDFSIDLLDCIHPFKFVGDGFLNFYISYSFFDLGVYFLLSLFFFCSSFPSWKLSSLI